MKYQVLLICLALWTGEMNQILCCDWIPKWKNFCHLALLRVPWVSRKKNFPESPLINPLLITLVWWRFLDVVWPFSFFCRFLNFHFILIDKKKLGHNQAILTLHLVNNPYVLWSNICHALMLSNEMSSMHVQLLDLDILWVAMRPGVCLHEIIETEASKWRRCRHWRET